MPKILCVAEKPSIARAVAEHLAGQRPNSRRTGAEYIMNYDFNFAFGPPWGHCSVTMTSVIGHLQSQDFAHAYRGWKSCSPGELFEAPIESYVDDKKKAIADNITREAHYAKALFIWTDCDREGEYIGSEISQIALKANPNLEVKRAKFSNIERAHVLRAAQNPIRLDERQVSAVAARIELDLRIGASFTRLQTLSIQPLGPELQNVISYGSCQFPTLGFVVDRYFRVRNFVPETFWYIKVTHLRDDINVSFSWKRVHLFDRMAATILFERCIASKAAKVTKVQTKPTSKWRPLPLTTVELQKLGSRLLGMDSQTAMKVMHSLQPVTAYIADASKIAEELYTKGFISYPRTETDQFDRGIDLEALIQKQTADGNWGAYAQGLVGGKFRQPRAGRNDDQAHPPIHPVAYVASNSLPTGEHRRLYEFVVRRFLACCSEDAKGEATTIEIEFGDEIFHTHGLLVRERNYLDVYPYDRWDSSQQLPDFVVGEQFIPTEAVMLEGQTGPPGYLTEPELIALMDANGIGTDATMAEHIAKIKEREYVISRPRSEAARRDDNGDDAAVRGGRGGRGRRGGRGSSRPGAGSGGGRGGRNTVQEFIPSTLGVALVEGYNSMGFEPSLSKPFLRKEMELKMKAICEGRKTKSGVVEESLGQYREVFIITSRRINVLKAAVRKFVLGEGE
ncbi:MAG: DNA topoisomerase [Geoglossum simile]|nr:MAG: DNA topoisomerase [Geoglossum simile]